MKSKIAKFAIAGGIGVLLLSFSALGFTRALRQRSRNVDYAEWMSNIANTTSLRDISMPGSHDTAALHSIADLAGQCQSLSILDQLNLGVRFLDIRLKLDHNNLKAVHGFVDQHTDFYEISKTVENFLDQHPSETVIMSIKEEADPSSSTLAFEEALDFCLTEEYFYMDNKLPETIGEVRGKIVLLSRYSGATIGIPAYDGWQDSCSFTLPNDIYVQDTYKVTSSDDKKNEIINCFNESGHALKINFLSAYNTGGFPPSYAPSVAKDINPWINQEISKYKDRGIVLYDFISESTMKAFFEGIL